MSADPGIVWSCDGKLLLQTVRCVHTHGSGSMPRPTIANLGAEPYSPHQPIDTILAAVLADITEVCMDLAVAIHATTFQPELLDQSGQMLILFCSS